MLRVYFYKRVCLMDITDKLGQGWLQYRIYQMLIWFINMPSNNSKVIYFFRIFQSSAISCYLQAKSPPDADTVS